MSEIPESMRLAREKYWQERDTDEKVAKLAELTHYLLLQVGVLTREVGALKSHGHDSGRVMVSVLYEREYDPTPHMAESLRPKEP